MIQEKNGLEFIVLTVRFASQKKKLEGSMVKIAKTQKKYYALNKIFDGQIPAIATWNLFATNVGREPMSALLKPRNDMNIKFPRKTGTFRV
ncbi:hypothetical protein UB23_15830 [Pseudomonas sp. ES3-33]|nr:hypothetical protein UB23_15830 [Pseudomonas sp. ES3-33]